MKKAKVTKLKTKIPHQPSKSVSITKGKKESRLSVAISSVLAFAAGAVPMLARASVESSLMAVQSKLINFILPVAGIIGLIFAGLSFVMGRENARAHLVLAIIGAGVGFGAPSLIEFIRGMVN